MKKIILFICIFSFLNESKSGLLNDLFIGYSDKPYKNQVTDVEADKRMIEKADKRMNEIVQKHLNGKTLQKYLEEVKEDALNQIDKDRLIFEHAKNGDLEKIKNITSKQKEIFFSKALPKIDEIIETHIYLFDYLNQMKLLAMLVAHDIMTITNDKGQTILHIAAYNNRTELVDWLSEKITVESKDYLGQTPLHKASQAKGLDSLRLLLSKLDNKTYFRIKDNNGNTPLHLLVERKSFTPVPEASFNKTLHSFVKSGLIGFDIKNNKGETPIDIAITLDDHKTKNILIKAQKRIMNKGSKAKKGLSLKNTFRRFFKEK